MALQVSTGTKVGLLAAFPAIFNGGHIRIFSGTKPVSADSPQTGTFLGAITNGGNPVSLGAYSGIVYKQFGPFITNDDTQLLGLVVENAGLASWFRIVGPAPDNGGPSYDLPRIDGECSVYAGNGPLFLPSVSLTLSQFITPISFTYTIPPIVGL